MGMFSNGTQLKFAHRRIKSSLTVVNRLERTLSLSTNVGIGFLNRAGKL